MEVDRWLPQTKSGDVENWPAARYASLHFFTYRVRYLHPCGCLPRRSGRFEASRFFFGFARDRGSKQASHVKTEGCKKRDKQKESKAYAWLLIFTSLFLFELGTPLPMAAMNWAQVSFDDPDTLVEEGEGRLVGMQCPPAPRLGPLAGSFELPPQWTSFHFHPYLGKIPVLTNIFQWVGSTTNQQIMK